MVITIKLYEMFLECFNYQYPDEDKVIELFGTKKLDGLIKEICHEKYSRTKQLMVVREFIQQLTKDLNTIARMKSKLSIPDSKSDLPKITYSQNHPMDELIQLRNMRVVIDNAGFTDENGKTMYFDMPLTTAFHIYFKTIAKN